MQPRRKPSSLPKPALDFLGPFLFGNLMHRVEVPDLLNMEGEVVLVDGESTCDDAMSWDPVAINMRGNEEVEHPHVIVTTAQDTSTNDRTSVFIILFIVEWKRRNQREKVDGERERREDDLRESRHGGTEGGGGEER